MDAWKRFLRHSSGLAGSAVVLLVVLAALLAPRIAPGDPLKQDYQMVLQAPSPAHPFGTDEIGRDLLSRVIYGARTSLLAGLLSVGMVLGVGLPVGLLTGYFRGVWDEWVVMRIVDAMQAFPFLILALAIAAVLGPGLTKAMIAIGIGLAPGFCASPGAGAARAGLRPGGPR